MPAYNPKVKVDFKGKTVLAVHEVAFHRNGISGAPFHIIRFKGEDSDNMIGVVFEEDDDNPKVAVFDNNKLRDNVIAFMENSWRGDNYEKELRQVIELWSKENYKD